MLLNLETFKHSSGCVCVCMCYGVCDVCKCIYCGCVHVYVCRVCVCVYVCCMSVCCACGDGIQLVPEGISTCVPTKLSANGVSNGGDKLSP